MIKYSKNKPDDRLVDNAKIWAKLTDESYTRVKVRIYEDGEIAFKRQDNGKEVGITEWCYP